MSKILHPLQFRSLLSPCLWLFCGILISNQTLQAQPKYWYFIKQSVSKDSASAMLLSNGLQPVQWSDWFHAWSAAGEPQSLPLADSSRLVAPLKIHAGWEKNEKLGFALEQINGGEMINAGYSGKGVKIGIIDGGFLGADQSTALHSIIAGGRMKAFRNFLPGGEQDPYAGTLALDDQHGTDVWELAGGQDLRKNIQFGLATAADYYLARTDHGAREQRQEEDFLIAALEWMYSQQVKLVNVSLGYNTDFDNPGENYSTDMMNGKTTLVSLACQRAAEKNMLIVVASGNDGSNAWKILSAPADAPGVLTVGSTDLKFWKKMDFSSVGPGFTAFLKPDVACFSSSGTSFSAPVITGLAACLWEQNPSLNASELKSLIMQSGHLAAAPNNYLGYGVPDCAWLMNHPGQNFKPTPASAVFPVKKKKAALLVLPQPGTNHVVLFHKKDTHQVIDQQFFSSSGGQLRVKPIQGARYTTVVANHEFLMEIEWVR